MLHRVGRHVCERVGVRIRVYRSGDGAYCECLDVFALEEAV